MQCQLKILDAIKNKDTPSWEFLAKAFKLGPAHGAETANLGTQHFSFQLPTLWIIQ
jgi:hypothetical protein